MMNKSTYNDNGDHKPQDGVCVGFQGKRYETKDGTTNKDEMRKQ